MSWSAPMTAVANTAFAAVDFNSDVRDNLLETLPGRAISTVASGSLPVKSATNQITFRTPTQAEISTSQSTSSTSYTNLSTAGPSVTATTGSGAIVFLHSSLLANGTNYAFMSFQVSNGGSITHSSDDSWALRHSDQNSSNAESMFGLEVMLTDLTPGLNTFQAKYKVSGGTGTYRFRRIGVIPL